MDIQEKAALYDDLVRKGQDLHRQVYNIKMKLKNTKEDTAKLKTLGHQISNIEAQMYQLMNNA